MTRSKKAFTVSRVSVKSYGPGEEVRDARPGDFILTHGSAWTSKMIRVGQGLRIHGADRKYTWWNHAAIFVGSDGAIVEALGTGVTEDNVSKYAPTEYTVVRIDAEPLDREEAVRFAISCERQEYGYLTIASIGLSLVTGTKFQFGFDGEYICSGLVARAMERTRAIFNRESSHIMPADLAKYYDAEPPSPGSSRGTVPR